MASNAMAATVLLKDIIDGLEMQSDDYLAFLELETGAVHTVSKEALSAAEAGEDEDWDGDDEFEIGKRIIRTDGFEDLPTKFDIHEWSIMEDFASSVKSERIGRELMDALHGAGAFRRFKEALRRRGIEKAWFAFRANALREIAIEWCEENEIKWR